MEKNYADMDSDSIYTTNQPQIVEFAKYCYTNYPTIENNIKKDSNHYNNTPEDFARIDNKLMAANVAIGVSSNLAQDAQSYMYKYNDQLYPDCVCILSVLAQISIDSAKRAFDIDLIKEIERLKNLLNIKENGKAEFWKKIKKKGKFKKVNNKKKEELTNKDIIEIEDETLKSISDDNLRESIISYSEKNNAQIELNNSREYESAKKDSNKESICPMDYVSAVRFPKFRSDQSTLPMSDFFIRYELKESRRKSKKIEDLIENYAYIKFQKMYDDSYEYDRDFGEQEFELLIQEIKNIYVSNDYVGLMSYLIDRAFLITPQMKANKGTVDSITRKNKVNLFSILYKINPDAFLSCFAKKIKN